MSNAFKILALGLSFTSSRGDLLPQQLFQLPLTSNNGFSLNDVAKGINNEIKANGEEEFVSSAKTNTVVELLNLKLDFVKEVIAYRQEQIAAREGEEARLRESRILLEALENRKIENLQSMSIEEIEAKIKELDSKKA